MTLFVITGNIRNITSEIVNEKKKVRFRVSSYQGGKDENNKYASFWFDVWEKQAEFVEQYFPEGKGIEVSGRITTYSYVPKGEEKTRTLTEFRVNNIDFSPKDNSGLDNESTSKTESAITSKSKTSDKEFNPFEDE